MGGTLSPSCTSASPGIIGRESLTAGLGKHVLLLSSPLAGWSGVGGSCSCPCGPEIHILSVQSPHLSHCT